MIRHLTTRLLTDRNKLWLSQSVRLFSINLIHGKESYSSKDERMLKDDLNLNGVHLDEVDSIISDLALKPISNFPNVHLESLSNQKPVEGHNLMVIQPWVSYTNFGEFTDPDVQLDECVSLGNTIHNWKVVSKKLIFANSINKKHLVSVKAFEELKETIFNQTGISAVMFGVELLSGIQLSTLERELKMPVFDRFTVVLNIFRQHARTKESKIQVALAELPYIRSHLREIHSSSEYSSTADSLKTLIGGVGDKIYRQRLAILKKREQRLKYLLEQIQLQRAKIKKQRRKEGLPTISVVGYTNSGKTSLIKYLTEDERLEPKDQLFATLDVTVHSGSLPSAKSVLYLDTIGFLSRIPVLLIEAFSASLREIQDTDLIMHVIDVSHPDRRLQYSTVVEALKSLNTPKQLIESRFTVGNKIDQMTSEIEEQSKTRGFKQCDIQVSVTNNINLDKLVVKLDDRLSSCSRNLLVRMRVENGGKKYSWLRRNGTILECQADEEDANYLICRVSLNPAYHGRWIKKYGEEDILSSD